MTREIYYESHHGRGCQFVTHSEGLHVRDAAHTDSSSRVKSQRVRTYLSPRWQPSQRLSRVSKCEGQG